MATVLGTDLALPLGTWIDQSDIANWPVTEGVVILPGGDVVVDGSGNTVTDGAGETVVS